MHTRFCAVCGRGRTRAQTPVLFQPQRPSPQYPAQKLNWKQSALAEPTAPIFSLTPKSLFSVGFHFLFRFPVPGDLRERLQAPADVVSVRRGSFGRPALRLGQTRVGADVPAAGVRLLAGRALGTGECPLPVAFQLKGLCKLGRENVALSNGT